MTDNFRFAQLQNFSLAGGGAVSGATSIILKSMTDIDGGALTMSGTFGAIGYGTLEPGNGTLEEQISFTGLTNNSNGTVTLSGVKNVLFVYPYTETSGLSKTHAGSVTFVISNTSGFYNTLTDKADDETITGQWTFPDNDTNAARIASDVDTAVATAFVTLGQLSRQAISGASNASTTVKGIVQLPTQAQVDAKTTTGSTSALLALTPDKQRSTLLSDYVADTGAADAYVITPVPAITAYTVGQRFTWKAANTNTTTSTINVSALGVKTIKKADGATNLVAGDIVAGQIVEVEYDGTNFQMLTPVANAPALLVPTGTISMYAGASAPAGFLFCDASAVSRTTYAALFAIISTTYGAGDASTTFNVPDMRGRVPVGVGTGTGGGASGTGLPTGGSALTAIARSTWKGEETHLLVTSESGQKATTALLGTDSSGGAIVGVNASSQSDRSGSVNLPIAGASAAAAHNNIQPVTGVNFIIKT